MDESLTPQIVAYHEATKHHFHAYAAGPGYLDWVTQPDPFRRYVGAPVIPLARAAPGDAPAYDDGFTPGRTPPAALDFAGVSRLFFDTLALSAWKEYGGNRWALRVNPSSGNLHPTEGYLICGATPGLCETPVVAHYAPAEHGLEVRARLSDRTWQDLREGVALRAGEGLPPETLFFGFTSIHWREAWKYGERAYRYCQHDAGHALAALGIAAAGLGWEARLLDDLGTDQVGTLLGVAHPAGAEPEHPDCLVAVYPHGTVFRRWQLPQSVLDIFRPLAWQGQPNTLSPAHVAWPWLAAAAEITRKPATGRGAEGSGQESEGSGQRSEDRAGADAAAGEDEALRPSASSAVGAGAEVSGQRAEVRGQESEVSGQGSEDRAGAAAAAGEDEALRPSASSAVGSGAEVSGEAAASLRGIIHRRRSAVEMDGRTTIERAAFYRILLRTMPRAGGAPFAMLPWPPRVHLALFVHRVRGLEPGLYFLARDAGQVAALRAALKPEFTWETPAGCPSDLPFYRLASGDWRGIARRISCGQDIAADGCFSLGMLAEFERPLTEHGAWVYPRLFWECGMIGQVLYLEAEAAGVRGTGIGCFFDDAMHSLLGLHDRQYQSLYHFTVGGPVDDPRLTTLPAYGADAAG